MISYLASGIISGRLTYERVANSPLVQKNPEVLKEINAKLKELKREDLIPKSTESNVEPPKESKE